MFICIDPSEVYRYNRAAVACASEMDDFEEQLAETVKHYSHLYNCSNKPYKESQMAKNSWKEISQLLCTEESVCRKRWRSLRDKFAKAKRRVERWKRENPGGRRKPVPALYTALQWLDSYIKSREATVDMNVFEVEIDGGIDDVEKEPEKDKKELLDSLPVITTIFSAADSSPSSLQTVDASLKRKRQTSTQTEKSSADTLAGLRDEDELFLLSLLPSIKRLSNRKKMEVRMKFQQVLYSAEFENSNS
uniref:Uncharacterized protein LOC106513154 isoform X2 n=1 Tax=Austrofundulus limnaeus TaxID=52670 RepID=A0A2I4AP61_AUSLI